MKYRRTPKKKTKEKKKKKKHVHPSTRVQDLRKHVVELARLALVATPFSKPCGQLRELSHRKKEGKKEKGRKEGRKKERKREKERNR